MFEVGQILNDTYEVVGQIGSGGMSTVFRAKHIRLQKDVVIKQIDADVKDFGQTRAEVDILKSLSHRNLPQVYDYFECDGEIYTVIDFIHGINLQEFIENGNVPTTSQLVSWMKQLCDALDYLHEQEPPIIHSDIKPANVMLKENGEVCLIDFNVSLAGAGIEMSGFTKNYGSPEQYNLATQGADSGIVIDKRTDIYSLGATFYYLMVRTAPTCIAEDLVSIQEYELPYPESLVDIIDKMMSEKKERRFSSAKKVMLAVNKLMLQDKRWKKLKILLGLGRFVAAIIFACGLLMVFYGTSLSQLDAFEGKYLAFVEHAESGTVSNEELLEEGNQLRTSFSGRMALYRNEYDYSLFYLYMAEAEAAAGNTETAEDYYLKSLSYGNVECYRQYIIVLIERADLDGAKTYLNEGIQLEMGLEDSCYLRGRLKEADGDNEAAYMEYKKALLSETDAERKAEIEAAINRVMGL